MLDFTVDREACIQCGECVKDCPYLIIGMGEEGYPEIDPEREEQCIRCQHCFAVCPSGALSILGLDPDESQPIKNGLPDPAALELLMKGRRSTRRYLTEPVDSELIARIMDVVLHAPTGVNRCSNRLTLIEDPAAMEALRSRTYEELRKVVEADALPAGLEFFAGYVKAWDKGVDVLYRGAPHFLVASAPSDGPSGLADNCIALSYFELLANNYGLGTVWDGLAKWALTVIVPSVAEMLNIPQDHTIGYMMAFGKPAVKYHRTVQRAVGTIDRITL